MAKKIPEEILRCPNCLSEKLTLDKTAICCVSCGRVYEHANNKFFFEALAPENARDSFGKIKYFFKKREKLYDFLAALLGPHMWDQTTKRFVRKYVEDKNLICLNLGSGTKDISPDVSNVDMVAYDNVDMTCNVEKLPLRDSCVDVIINESLLEHVRGPEKVVGEMRRVLKEGGLVYCLAPFVFNFHASPGDYTRWTIEGLRNLYGDFEILELKPGGPTSALLSIAQEWLAIIGSFGIRRLYLPLYLMIILLTFPLKFLDVILKHHPFAKNIADVFYIVAKKPRNPRPRDISNLA